MFTKRVLLLTTIFVCDDGEQEIAVTHFFYARDRVKTQKLAFGWKLSCLTCLAVELKSVMEITSNQSFQSVDQSVIIR